MEGNKYRMTPVPHYCCLSLFSDAANASFTGMSAQATKQRSVHASACLGGLFFLYFLFTSPFQPQTLPLPSCIYLSLNAFSHKRLPFFSTPFHHFFRFLPHTNPYSSPVVPFFFHHLTRPFSSVFLTSQTSSIPLIHVYFLTLSLPIFAFSPLNLKRYTLLQYLSLYRHLKLLHFSHLINYEQVL